MFAGEPINVSEHRSGAARRAARAARCVDTRRRRNVVPEVHAVLDRMGAFADGCAAVHGRATPGKRDPQRRQHRHRRLRLGPVMAYEALKAYSKREMAFPLRLERRWDGLRRGGARSRSGADDVHRLLQDLHDPRDHDQCRRRHANGCCAGLGGDVRRSRKHFVAVSTNADGSAEVRHRHRRTCSGSGTG